MDDAMRFVGQRYLDETLRPSIERIVAEHKPCEIDPSRVKDKASIHQNLFNLKVSCVDGQCHAGECHSEDGGSTLVMCALLLS